MLKSEQTGVIEHKHHLYFVLQSIDKFASKLRPYFFIFVVDYYSSRKVVMLFVLVND